MEKILQERWQNDPRIPMSVAKKHKNHWDKIQEKDKTRRHDSRIPTSDRMRKQKTETINYVHQGGLQMIDISSASKDIYNFKMLGTFGLDEGQELMNVETQREASILEPAEP